MKRAWEAEDNGANDLHFDAYYCELQADINFAEVEGEISSEQAWYLRGNLFAHSARSNLI